MDVRPCSPRSTCILLLVLALAPAVASAAAGDPVDKVTTLNKRALDAYKKRDYEGARTLLKQALDVANTAELERHPIKARTHIHFGIVTIVGFKQRDLGIKHFRKALDIQPDIKLTKTLVTPELQDAFDEAVLAGGDASTPAPAATEEPGGEAAPTEAAPQAEEGGEDRPRAKRRARRPADEEGGEEGGEEEEDEDAPTYRLFMAVTVGSGFGVASGSGELNPAHTLRSAGFAPAQLGHVSPELGFFIKPNLLLSARVRLQYVNGLTVQASAACSGGFCDPATTAFAAFARAAWFLGTGSFRWFFGGELGFGNIRHAQVFPADTSCGPMRNIQCVDTLASGPFLFGPAVGLLYDFSNVVGLLFALNVDLGVPKFTANIDANAGIALHF